MVEDTRRYESDAHAQLDALYRRRDELRAAIGAETEPDVRAELLSMLKRNRANINRLSAELGIDRSDPMPITTSLSKVVVDTGEHQDLVDHVNHELASPEAMENDPDYYPGVHSHGPPQRPLTPQSTRDIDSGPPTGRGRFVPGLMLALGLVAVTAAGAFAVYRLVGLGEDGDDGDTELTAGPETQQATDRLTDMRAVLAGMGLAGVQVEERDSTIFLTGTVATEADRNAVIGAISALAQGKPIDATQLVASGQPAVEGTVANPGQAERLQAEIDRVIAATPIIFETNQTELTDLHRRILNNVATIVLAYQDASITIVGFTDDVGDPEVNERVSLARAMAVKDYLISQGVPEAALLTEARGEDTSLGSEAVANLERRVEFEVAGIPGSQPGDASTLRVAVVAPSASDDRAFTQSMVDAVNALANDRGNVDVTLTDGTFVPDEATAAIRDYATQGYDLVIAHGSQYGQGLVEVAREFPDVSFAWGTASETFGLPNIYAYDAAANEGGYVLGALAALISESGVVGVVGPIEVGDAELYVNGFRAGALAEQPSTEVRVIYTDSFSDLTLAAEAATEHIDNGADVLTGTAQMVAGAVSVAEERGVLWFGTQSNQTSLAPDRVVASQVYHWEVILDQIVADIDAGAVAGRSYRADLANGGLVIEYNADVPIPPEAKARADAIVAGIINGTINAG